MNEPPAANLAPWRRRLDQGRIYLRRAAPTASGVVATLVALLLYNWLFPPPKPISTSDVTEITAQAIASITPVSAYSAFAYQVIRPSLVLIQVETVGNEEDDNDHGNGLGSGVVIDNNASILTSLHVVTNSLMITVTFADGSESAAQIISAQPEHDIAVLRPTKLPGLLVPAVLGNPGAMKVGDEVYAVGHPLGLYASMSAGIISGFDRSFQPPNNGQRLEGLIQIDAAVNPGNSGGPLLNRGGYVIGIVTGLANPTDGNFFIGIGFAVPINVAAGGGGGQAPPY